MSPSAVRLEPTEASPHVSSGFTLVELIVAMTVLSVGLLALTGAGAAIVRLERAGDRLSRAAAAAESRVELLRAEGCTAISGMSETGNFIERWTVTPMPSGVHELVDSLTEVASPAGAARRTYVYRSATRC